MLRLPALAVFELALLLQVASSSAPAEGWNDKISWLRLDEATRMAPKENKPIMVLVHMNWCGACKALKPKFAASKDIEKISKHFLMVNAGNEFEPKDSKFRPDGPLKGYYPRIVFLSSLGGRLELEGPNPEYKAFYPSPEDVVKAMKKSLKMVGKDYEELEKEEQRRLDEQKRADHKAHQDSVPAMVDAIFTHVDADHNGVLSVNEFGVFVEKIGGAKPTEQQYQGMCKAYGATEAGLTKEIMAKVYQARGKDDIARAYKQIVQKQEL